MAVSTWVENPVALINFKSCQTLNIVGIFFPGRILILNFFKIGLQMNSKQIVCVQDRKNVKAQAWLPSVEIFRLDCCLFTANLDFPGPDYKYYCFPLFLLESLVGDFGTYEVKEIITNSPRNFVLLLVAKLRENILLFHRIWITFCILKSSHS